MSRLSVLILDFGSQYTQLIARSIRDLGVQCEVHPHNIPLDLIKSLVPQSIILSGSPNGAVDDKYLSISSAVFELQIPMLGICYGMQVMVCQLGGSVKSVDDKEFGSTQAKILMEHVLFAGVSGKREGVLDVWMSHSDQIDYLPPEFSVLMSSDNTPIAAIADDKRKLYAVQFHPEVTHCEQGRELLKNFIFTICKCSKTWFPAQSIDKRIADIKRRIGSDEVILAVSGGVDSTVVACLISQAIGKQLHCIFIDNGLLRHDESVEVKKLFARVNIDLVTVDAKERFLAALGGVIDPEEKRKIIGGLFVAIFEEQARECNNVKWLAQGTIYPDIIESSHAGSNSDLIKTHHNVGGLPQDMKLRLLEPIRDLFKDEVRKLAAALNIPADIYGRHPFPGPGLAVRVIGEVKEDCLDILRRADVIFMEELHLSGWHAKSSQAFAVFLPVKSVGVLGDGRSYGYVIALRIVSTADFMTAQCVPLPHEVLFKVSSRIINEVAGVARVVFDISSKPPATIEWE